MRSLEHSIIETLFQNKTKAVVVKEEVEQLDEASNKYHVSVVYSKGYGGNAQHEVKHYTTPRPKVPDHHIGSILRSHVRENVPQHMNMIKNGWRTDELGMYGSHEAVHAKKEAEERHAAATATTKMIKDKYGSMKESVIEEVEKDKTRLDTVKKIKSTKKDNKVIIDPELKQVKDSETV